MTEVSIGERMKQYERQERTVLPRRQFIVIRVDGRAFHTWCRGLHKPYSPRLVDTMGEVTQALLEQVGGALIGYAQSDEISIVAQDFKTAGTEAWFGGGVQKIASIAAAEATAAFNKSAQRGGSYIFPEENWNDRKPATFDARVFTLPSREEVANYILWRRRDATKNAITTVAAAGWSDRELHGLNTADRLALIKDGEMRTGIRYEDIDRRFLNGQVVTRETKVERVRFWDKRLDQYVTTTDPVERRYWSARAVTDAEVDSGDMNWVYEQLPEIPERDRPKPKPVHPALQELAELVPKEDEWQSAAGTMECLAETLDRHGIPRPDHYDEDIDIR